MDIGTSYKIKAINENIDITKYLDAINELDLPSFIAGDTYISTLDTGGETEFEEVWDTARKIAACIPDIDFSIKGAVEAYSVGEIDFFEIQVKDKKIFSKHSGYVQPLQSDEFEDYEEFIEEYPDLEEPFTEDEFEKFIDTEDGIMYITSGGFGAVVPEDKLPVITDEMDL